MYFNLTPNNLLLICDVRNFKIAWENSLDGVNVLVRGAIFFFAPCMDPGGQKVTGNVFLLPLKRLLSLVFSDLSIGIGVRFHKMG